MSLERTPFPVSVALPSVWGSSTLHRTPLQLSSEHEVWERRGLSCCVRAPGNRWSQNVLSGHRKSTSRHVWKRNSISSLKTHVCKVVELDLALAVESRPSS